MPRLAQSLRLLLSGHSMFWQRTSIASLYDNSIHTHNAMGTRTLYTHIHTRTMARTHTERETHTMALAQTHAHTPHTRHACTHAHIHTRAHSIHTRTHTSGTHSRTHTRERAYHIEFKVSLFAHVFLMQQFILLLPSDTIR